MLPVANPVPIGSKVLPVILAVGGATAAGGYVRSHSRAFGSYVQSNNTIQAEPASKPLFENSAPETRSKFFTLVLESIFA